MSKTKPQCKRVTEIDGHYQFQNTVTRQEIIDLALDLQFKNLQAQPAMTNPEDVKNYFRIRLAENKNEVFSVMFLTSKHQIIDCIDMFTGTIDSAHVSVRAIVMEVLRLNAAAIIVAHNHPSGVPEPSGADRSLTESISIAMGLISVRLLDHIVVGDGCSTSFAELGAIG
jgi:DNA repair protein RadC